MEGNQATARRPVTLVMMAQGLRSAWVSGFFFFFFRSFF